MSEFERIGGTEECPIVEARYFLVPCGEMMLKISPSHDFIMTFPDPKFNYLLYWDNNERCQKIIFCNQAGLDYLHTECGLAPIHRDKITDHEVDMWANWYSHQVEQEMIDEGF